MQSTIKWLIIICCFQLLKMGTTHEKSLQQATEDRLFLFKQMIKKSSVSNPQVFYRFAELIGEGGSSQVYKIQSLSTGQYRAIKKVKKVQSKIPGRQILNQYSILRQLDHPNIRRIYEMFQNESHYFIVTQYLPGRDLLHFLLDQKTLQQQMVYNIFYQTLLAVNHMHKNNVMHRDIKLQNIIYDETTMNFKLIDFGSALRYTSLAPVERKCTGTINYIAPEVINKFYNMKCDIWSLGILLYILLSGNAPFSADSDKQIVQKTLKNPLTFDNAIWDSRSKQVKRLITSMLQKNFERRPSASDILKDPWILKYKKRQEIHKSQKQAICTCLQRLIKFTKIKALSLQIGMLSFMSYFLIKKQNEVSLIRSFFQINKNNNGQIEEKQIKQALIDYLGMTAQVAESNSRVIMQKLDIDKSGKMTFSEFALGATDLRQLLSFQNIRKTFSYMDIDNSKSISALQLQVRLGNHIDQSQYHRFLKDFDSNNDEQIDLQEFFKMMKQILKNY